MKNLKPSVSSAFAALVLTTSSPGLASEPPEATTDREISLVSVMQEKQCSEDLARDMAARTFEHYKSKHGITLNGLSPRVAGLEEWPESVVDRQAAYLNHLETRFLELLSCANSELSEDAAKTEITFETNITFLLLNIAKNHKGWVEDTYSDEFLKEMLDEAIEFNRLNLSSEEKSLLEKTFLKDAEAFRLLMLERDLMIAFDREEVEINTKKAVVRTVLESRFQDAMRSVAQQRELRKGMSPI